VFGVETLEVCDYPRHQVHGRGGRNSSRRCRRS